MRYMWLLPPPGTVKVNVYGASTFIPFPNGNSTGIGMIAQDVEGELLKLSTGIIPSASSLENKLNAILHGLKRSFEDKYKEVIIETYNIEAFTILKNFPNGVPPEVAFVTQQIIIRLHDPRWICSIIFIYPERNMVAISLAKLGAERCNHLFILSCPVGAVEELLSRDMGFGHIDPQFQDIEIAPNEEDPVDFEGRHMEGHFAHVGYAFKEDYFAMDNPEGEGHVVLKMHEVLMEDVILGQGYLNKHN